MSVPDFATYFRAQQDITVRDLLWLSDRSIGTHANRLGCD